MKTRNLIAAAILPIIGYVFSHVEYMIYIIMALSVLAFGLFFFYLIREHQTLMHVIRMQEKQEKELQQLKKLLEL